MKALSESAFFQPEHMMKLSIHRFNLVAATLAASTLMVACGGGGSASAPALTAQTALVAVATPAAISTSGTSALSTTGGSGTGAVTYTVASGTCTISSSTLTAPATAGTCTVTATKAADATYAAATSAATTVTVTAPVIVVQNQTASQDSYVVATAVSLPGNNSTGSYEFGVTGTGWWSGVGTDSVYRGVGVATADTGGVGVYVQGAGTTTWSISGRTSMTVGLGTNAECVGTCKATIILKNSSACIATINAPITILTSGVNTGLGATQVNGAVPSYTATLTDANWTVTGCTTNTMTAFKLLTINEVHAQLLKANMQTTTLAGTSGLYANGINLGGIKFQ